MPRYPGFHIFRLDYFLLAFAHHLPNAHLHVLPYLFPERKYIFDLVELPRIWMRNQLELACTLTQSISFIRSSSFYESKGTLYGAITRYTTLFHNLHTTFHATHSPVSTTHIFTSFSPFAFVAQRIWGSRHCRIALRYGGDVITTGQSARRMQ